MILEESKVAPDALLAGSRPARARRNVLAAMIGNIMEYYDFVIYAFLAQTLARNFFQGDKYGGMLATFATFGVGFLARPLGGAIIGAIADKHGRRLALVITIVGMAIGTVGIGFLPTYASAGLLAPVLLLALRLIQGLAAGGEWGTAASFLVESAPDGKRGYFGGLGQASITASALLSSVVVMILNASFSTAEIDQWAWRVPFLLGGLLLPVGIYMRRNLDETPAFVKAKTVSSPTSASSGVTATMMGKLFSINIINTVAYYVMLGYMPTFLSKYAGLSSTQALISNSIALVILVAATPLVGKLSDRFGRKPFLLLTCFGFAVFSVVLFRVMLNGASFGLIIAIQIFFNLVLAGFSGAGVSTFCEIFPTQSRTMLLSISYSLSTAIFGGFAPFISTWLIGVTGTPIAPAFYLTAAAIVSGIVIFMMRETAHERLG